MLKERVEPRISVNKLGEYAATNSATRRRRIVLDQKKPKDFIVSRYSDAQDLVADFLSGNLDYEDLLDKVDEFRNTTASTDWQENRNKVCAEALLSFIDMADKLDFGSLVLTKGEQTPPRLLVQSVSVSIKPELLITKHKRSGDSVAGAVKLHMSKSYTMSDNAGSYAATMLQQFVEANSQFPCDRRLCYVVDVFGQRIFTAPRSHIRRRKAIEASCEEINRAWPEL
ncbi:hypothetical protein [Rubrobacter aplysinae]|uniref:hypothetical protein n=1 Tax=Rubrobacter aplysinae TaxID=909625 RepID=UPI00128D87B1|nr:hypothetical protein [Rubrobacter aplysinae]